VSPKVLETGNRVETDDPEASLMAQNVCFYSNKQDFTGIVAVRLSVKIID
jgi:hypothetical protein